MPVYHFKGMTQAGKNTSGIRNCESVRSLQALLRKEGIFPTDIEQQKERAKSSDIDLKKLTGRVSTRELSVITRQLATHFPSNELILI